MKIALVHDQLQEFGGSERVLVALKKIFPQADVYTLVYHPKKLGRFQKIIKKWNIKVSWFGKIPLLNHFYSPFRFLTPLIWESFDFSKPTCRQAGYDLIISSSGSWMSKGIKTRKPTIHIAYIHHPPRYLYGYETAIEWQKYLPVKIYGYLVNHFLRIWDFYSSQRPDFLIANSQETRHRIQKFYRRDATVIYPPVNIPPPSIILNELKDLSTNGSVKKSKNASLDSSVASLPQNDKKTKYYITVSRLARAKHIDVLIEAANKMKFNLKIVGSGRDEKYLRSIAGPTVKFLGSISDGEFKKLFKDAKAFLFAGVDEEFGIALIEAMGYGLPVIAYHSGGIPEYLKDGVNGYLFPNLTSGSLIEKITLFESLSEKKIIEMKKEARKTAENFSEEKFRERFLNFVAKIK